MTQTDRFRDGRLLINQIKRGDMHLQLPVKSDTGEIVGHLNPVTWSDVSNPLSLDRLTQWRNANMANFQSQFTATPARTARWLRETLLPNDRQMLFWLCSEDTVLGHLGFNHLTENDVEGDNAMRGAPGGHPKLFAFAHLAIFAWLFETFGVEVFRGYVFSDNVGSIMMSRQVGYTTWERFSLTRETRNGEVRWVLGGALAEDPGERFCWRASVTMKELVEKWKFMKTNS